MKHKLKAKHNTNNTKRDEIYLVVSAHDMEDEEIDISDGIFVDVNYTNFYGTHNQLGFEFSNGDYLKVKWLKFIGSKNRDCILYGYYFYPPPLSYYRAQKLNNLIY